MISLDHLVYGTSDLEAAIDRLEHALGVRAALGGRHAAWGTRNALISLGEDTYLEILAPDPHAPEGVGPRLFQVDRQREPRLLTWAAKGANLKQVAASARSQGVDLGEVQSGSRSQPDGVVLSWALTDPATPREDGIIPFLIDWGDTPHPAGTAPAGCSLMDLRAQHPDAERVQALLRALDVDLEVEAGAEPALIATIESPRGLVELR